MPRVTKEQLEKRRENLKRGRQLFEEFGGEIYNGFPAIHADVYHTKRGTPYLKKPGVVLIAKPQVEILGMEKYLKDYGEELGFGEYVYDPVILKPAAQLLKVAGQECYASYGPGRTWNIEAAGYLDDIKKDNHGSVLQHASFSLLVYGISRNVTHEWVRHGQGTTYSQRSQRYVSGRVLRFKERPEYQSDPELHYLFEERIDKAAETYEILTQKLIARQKAGENITLSAELKTDLRKKVQQTSRSVLPNETESSFIFSANARALQHEINVRTSEHAEVEIREPFISMLLCLMIVEPMLFADFEIVNYSDGTRGAITPYKKP